MENKLQKPYLRDYNFLKKQGLWQVHYQILQITLLKEFLKLNVNVNMVIKNAKRVKLNIKIMNAISNLQILKMI